MFRRQFTKIAFSLIIVAALSGCVTWYPTYNGKQYLTTNQAVDAMKSDMMDAVKTTYKIPTPLAQSGVLYVPSENNMRAAAEKHHSSTEMIDYMMKANEAGFEGIRRLIKHRGVFKTLNVMKSNDNASNVDVTEHDITLVWGLGGDNREGLYVMDHKNQTFFVPFDATNEGITQGYKNALSKIEDAISRLRP